MTLWELTKRQFEKRRQKQQEVEQRVNPLDRNLPFGLHLDGKIKIDPLLPEGLSAQFPVGEHIVDDFSETKVLGQTWFRVILLAEKDNSPSYLWIFYDKANPAQSCVRWFVQLDEIFPASKEEWDFWLSDVDGYIGVQQFQTKGEEAKLFDRIWGQSSDVRIEPIHFREEIILDRYDRSKTHFMEHRSMLYGREVKDVVCESNEYINLSACTEGDESHISIDVGVDLVVGSDITVIY